MIVSGSKRALGRASEDRSLVAALAAVVVVVVAMVPVPALASPSCLTSANKCEADALCTFKEELAAKVLTYQMYLKNAKRTKELKSRDGVAYDGTLYKQALAEAMKSFHNSSRAEQRVKAGQIFQELLEKYVKENFEIPTCRANGKLDKKLLPKPGYDGMYTDSKCLIWVKFDAGEVDPKGFASGKQETTCQEFYNRDLAHEVVHQKNCKAAKHAVRPSTTSTT